MGEQGFLLSSDLTFSTVRVSESPPFNYVEDLILF